MNTHKKKQIRSIYNLGTFKLLGAVVFFLLSTVVHSQCNVYTTNADFEYPPVTSSGTYINQDSYPLSQLGWRTTATDHLLEFWKNGGYYNRYAYSGTQFIELNATQASALYQDYDTSKATYFNYSFAHMGRDGVDTMILKAGPPGGPYTDVRTATTNNDAWKLYTGTYQVPEGQITTRFIFEAVSTFTGSLGSGNFLDAITFTATINPPLVIGGNQQTITSGSHTDFKVSGHPGSEFYWYDATGTNFLFKGDDFVTSDLTQNANYTVKQVNPLTNCGSSLQSVRVNVAAVAPLEKTLCRFETYDWKGKSYNINGWPDGYSQTYTDPASGETLKITASSDPDLQPVVKKTPASCTAPSSCKIENYNPTVYTYTFSPTGPRIDPSGLITGMVNGTPYKLNAKAGICDADSNTFSNDPQLAAPAQPILGPVTQPIPPATTGTFIITNYNPAYTYTILPSTGVIRSGNKVTAPAGQQYLVTATSGGCSSAASQIPFNEPQSFTCPTLTINPNNTNIGQCLPIPIEAQLSAGDYKILDTQWTLKTPLPSHSSISNVNSLTPTLRGSSAGYDEYELIVKVTSNTNLIRNGSFEQGYTDFTSNYNYRSGTGETVLWDSGTFAVVNNPNSVHKFFPNMGDHTSGTGKMMVVNGAEQANVKVWSQTIRGVKPHTKYAFSAFLASVDPDNPSVLNFSINGRQEGSALRGGSVGQWNQFYTVWDSGELSGDITIDIVNQQLGDGGNDFALDDLSFAEICERTATLKVTVNPLPSLTINPPAAVCSPDTVDLTAAAITTKGNATDVLTYWTDALATIALTSPQTAAAGTYYIKSTTVQNCYVIKPVTVRVNPLPSLTINPPAAVCSPDTVDLTAAAITTKGNTTDVLTYWTDALATIALASPTTVGAGTYYIKSTPVLGCSVTEPVTVKVNATPLKPTYGAITQPTITNSNGTFIITNYDRDYTYTITPSTGVSQNGSTITAPEGTYTLTAKLGDCISAASLPLEINPQPAAAVETTGASICKGAAGSLIASTATSSQPVTTFDGHWDTSTAGLRALPIFPTTKNSTTCQFNTAYPFGIRFYTATTFNVTASGIYILKMSDNSHYDGSAYIYKGNFTPGSCSAGGTWIIGDDDSGGTTGESEPKMTATLEPGITYTLISTTFGTAPENYGVPSANYTWTITPPSGGAFYLGAAGATSSPIKWYTSSSGGTSIGEGSPFNPVGVTGSGLSDTNTPGITIYYATAGDVNSPRTAVTFEIKDNAAAGAPSSTPTVCIKTQLTNITHTTTRATGIGTPTGLPAGVIPTWTSNTITISGTPTVAGIYNYSIPLIGDCGNVSATGTITVKEIAKPTVLTTPATCSAASTNTITNYANGNTYVFDPTGPSADTNGVITGMQTGITYNVTSTNADCTSALSAGFEYKSQPNLLESRIMLPVIPELCAGTKDGSFSVAISGGITPYNISLDNINGRYEQVTGTEHTFQNLSGGKHTVYIKDALGCATELEVVMPDAVAINPVTKVNYDCINNNSVTITVDASITDPSEIDYSLDEGAYQLSNIFKNLSPGQHTVMARHLNGCTQVTRPFIINYIEPLKLSLTDGEMNEIVATATGGSGNYQYKFEGESYSSTNKFIIYKTGDYTITVKDQNGCTDTVTRHVEYIDICIPNYFTPNGDGNNDEWGPGCTESYKNLTFTIIDRYGREIAHYRYGQKWDGKYNGTELTSGDYWYVIKLNDPKDNREFVGHFTLYR